MYTINLDNNNYILSIAHTSHDCVELDLSSMDLNYLSCYKYENGTVTLDEEKKASLIAEKEEKENTLSDSDKLALILASVSVDETNKTSDEVQTKPFYNTETHVIEYMDSGFRYGEGTETNPLQYVLGDTVTKDTYYCQYKYSDGNYYAQLTNGTYKAIADGTPSKFGVMTFFEKVY